MLRVFAIALSCIGMLSCKTSNEKWTIELRPHRYDKNYIAEQLSDMLDDHIRQKKYLEKVKILYTDNASIQIELTASENKVNTLVQDLSAELKSFGFSQVGSSTWEGDIRKPTEVRKEFFKVSSLTKKAKAEDVSIIDLDESLSYINKFGRGSMTDENISNICIYDGVLSDYAIIDISYRVPYRITNGFSFKH